MKNRQINFERTMQPDVQKALDLISRILLEDGDWGDELVCAVDSRRRGMALVIDNYEVGFPLGGYYITLGGPENYLVCPLCHPRRYGEPIHPDDIDPRARTLFKMITTHRII